MATAQVATDVSAGQEVAPGTRPAGGEESTTFTVCSRPVFVIGSPRSGTSILAWSLAQHPEFATSHETDFLLHLFGRQHLAKVFAQIGDRASDSWMNRHDVSREEFLAFLGLGVNALITSRSGDARWIDQSPSNTLLLDELARLFPRAAFLHILRDGRLVVNSMIRSSIKETWAVDFREAAHTWAHFTKLALEFGEREPSRCLTIPYANLVAQPRESFAFMLGFLDASPSPLPAEYFTTHRINSSYDQSTMLFGRTSVNSNDVRWRGDPDPWATWARDQREIFAEQAGPTLIRAGIATEEELAL